MNKLWMAPGGLHIEPAEPGDAEALARLHAAGFYRGWPREDFATYLLDPKTRAYVACDARRRVTGFAMIRLAADEAELLTIAVDPRTRGRGLGTALVRAVLADLLQTPARRLFLEVDEDNQPAVRLYRRHGFREIGRRKGYYAKPGGQAATALVMARDLD